MNNWCRVCGSTRKYHPDTGWDAFCCVCGYIEVVSKRKQREQKLKRILNEWLK